MALFIIIFKGAINVIRPFFKKEKTTSSNVKFQG
jgi:hypothetical protein